MVNRRSQILRENRVERTRGDEHSDNEDNISVADHYSGSYFNDHDDDTLRRKKGIMKDSGYNRDSWK